MKLQQTLAETLFSRLKLNPLDYTFDIASFWLTAEQALNSRNVWLLRWYWTPQGERSGQTFRAAAAHLDISPARVNQLHERALRILMNPRHAHRYLHGDWPQMPKVEHRRYGPDHPIFTYLYPKPLEARIHGQMRRRLSVYYGRGFDLRTLDLPQFLRELAQPKGGLIAQVYDIGPTTIEELRRVCAADLLNLPSSILSPEYGYA